MQGLPDHLRARTAAGRAGLSALLSRPGEALVALDYDGTLAPIVDDPARAYAHPDAPGVLARLAARFGSVAVVTGRPAATAVGLGGLAGVAGLEGLVVFGLYGAQRWDAATGRVEAAPPHPGIAAARAELPRLLAGLGEFASGVWVEDKGEALAVHARAAADPDLVLAVLMDAVLGLADRHGLGVEPGRYVVELRPPGVDKGTVLASYAEERAAGSVLYAGDDLGDIPAFAAVEGLRARGVPGITVAIASAETSLPAERADLVVGGPAELLAALAALAALARC